MTKDGRHVGLDVGRQAQEQVLAVLESDLVRHQEVEVRILILQPVHAPEKEPEQHPGQAVAVGTNAPQIGKAGDLDHLVGERLLTLDLPQQGDGRQGLWLGQVVATAERILKLVDYPPAYQVVTGPPFEHGTPPPLHQPRRPPPTQGIRNALIDLLVLVLGVQVAGHAAGQLDKGAILAPAGDEAADERPPPVEGDQ